MPQLFGWDYLVQLTFALTAYFFVVELSRKAIVFCQRIFAQMNVSLFVILFEGQFN